MFTIFTLHKHYDGKCNCMGMDCLVAVIMIHEHGNLWPGVITKVGEDYEAFYKINSKRFPTWKECEDWIKEQKDNELGSTIYC